WPRSAACGRTRARYLRPTAPGPGDPGPWRRHPAGCLQPFADRQRGARGIRGMRGDSRAASPAAPQQRRQAILTIRSEILQSRGSLPPYYTRPASSSLLLDPEMSLSAWRISRTSVYVPAARAVGAREAAASVRNPDHLVEALLADGATRDIDHPAAHALRLG